MKRLLSLVVFTTIALCALSQTKIAYLDLYQRGGGQNLKTSLTFKDTRRLNLYRMSLGEALNMLAEQGWIVDQTLIGANRLNVITRVITRHKFHIILKKAYTDGENPFEGLYSLPKSSNDVKKDIVNKDEELTNFTDIRNWYYQYLRNPSAENIKQFQQLVDEYKQKYSNSLYPHRKQQLDKDLDALIQASNQQ